MVNTQFKQGTRKSPLLYVSPKEAKKHIEKLISVHNMTIEGIARAAGVGRATLDRILRNEPKRIYSSTLDKILGVAASDKSIHALPLTLLRSEKSVRLIEEMHEAGFSYKWLIDKTGWTEFWQARKYHQPISAKNARKVKSLHDKLWRDNTEGSYVWGGGPYPNRIIKSGKTLRQTCHCYDSMLKDDKRKQYTIERDRSARRNRESKDQLMVGTGL